jgi:H+/Cl- antiporter ClcA
MSNKRILLALILAGTVGFLGLHRLYAGRYYTALVQLLLFLAGAAMLWKDLAPLQAMQSLEDLLDWLQGHPQQPLPWLLVGIPSMWAIIDCYYLIARKFKDGAGNKMTRWI